MNLDEIWWQGDLSPHQVFLYGHSDLAAPLTPAVRQAMQQRCEQLRRGGQRVENLPLYRVLGWSVDQTGLHLQVTHTQYEDYLGLGLLGHPQAPLVLTVAAATEVEDQLVLERRSRMVAQGVGLLHVKPSGHVHPPSSPWQALQQEAFEELALQPEELGEARVLGLVKSRTANCLSLIYRLRSNLSWQSWQARTPVDAWEADELLGLPTDKASLTAWLAQSCEQSTGPGYAAVFLYYQRRYGQPGGCHESEENGRHV